MGATKQRKSKKQRRSARNKTKCTRPPPFTTEFKLHLPVREGPEREPSRHRDAGREAGAKQVPAAGDAGAQTGLFAGEEVACQAPVNRRRCRGSRRAQRGGRALRGLLCVRAAETGQVLSSLKALQPPAQATLQQKHHRPRLFWALAGF